MISKCGLAAAFLVFALVAASGQDKKAGEWQDLVAGDIAKHWTTKGNWTLKDGVISLTPRAGEKGWSRFDAYLWSKEKVTDFECEFEYKVEKEGNSGFYFRVGDVTSPVKNGIEVQIFDEQQKKGDKLTDHDSGGVIPGIPPKKAMGKKAGEWNKMEVTSKTDKLTVKLNGEVVNEVDLTIPALKDRPRTGFIGFQDHGLPMDLKNIKIRETK